MPRPLAFVAVLATAHFAFAQQPTDDRPKPVALVSQAERALQRQTADVEGAVLMLWHALDLLGHAPADPVQMATIASARALLRQHDALEPERRRVFASVAKQQVDVATTYRNKHWLDVAANRLGIADRYDADVGVKEHAAIAAARQKAKVAAAAPAAKKDAKAPKRSPLMHRANTVRVIGQWRDVDECLESPARKGTELVMDEWMPNQDHADNEIVVEWKPTDPNQAHNAGMWVAFVDGDPKREGIRVLFSRRANSPDIVIELLTREFTVPKSLGGTEMKAMPQADGFHRLAIRVSGNRLAVQLDNAPPLEVDAGYPLRGKTGLMGGAYTKSTSCPIRFRNLRIDPLPADQPEDKAVLAEAEAKSRDAVTQAVTEGKALLAQKQLEAASIRLREALTLVDENPPGVLRDNLRKSIDPLLLQADSLVPRRRKVAQTSGAELGALADKYAEKGLIRAGLALANHAAAFDAEGQAARAQSMRDRVQQWNIAQATARASELVPPADDGTVMRDWFAKGKGLIVDTAAFTFDGPFARADGIEGQMLSVWAADPAKPKLTKASVYVYVSTPFINSGLCFDFVDQSDYTVAMVDRSKVGLRVAVHRWTARQWVKLAEQSLPLDDWRFDGWFQLTVESNEQGMTVQCADIKIEVPREQMGKQHGTFGLVIGNYGKKIAGGQVRAFQPGQ